MRFRPGTTVILIGCLLLLLSITFMQWKDLPKPLAITPPPEGLQIDINQATVQDLTTLPGIGPSLAQRIVTMRKIRGNFRTVDEMMAVKGIGNKKMSRIRKYLRVGNRADEK